MKKIINLGMILLISLLFSGCFEKSEEEKKQIAEAKEKVIADKMVEVAKKLKPFNELEAFDIISNKLKFGDWSYDKNKSIVNYITKVIGKSNTIDGATDKMGDQTTAIIMDIKIHLNGNNKIKTLTMSLKKHDLYSHELSSLKCSFFDDSGKKVNMCEITKPNFINGIASGVSNETLDLDSEKVQKFIKNINDTISRISKLNINKLNPMDKLSESEKLAYIKNLYLPMGIGTDFYNLNGTKTEILVNKIGKDWYFDKSDNSFRIKYEKQKFVKLVNEMNLVTVDALIKLDKYGFIEHSSLNGMSKGPMISYNIDCSHNINNGVYKCNENIIKMYGESKSHERMGDVFFSLFIDRIFN